ncbi:phage holin family protein [Promicromonospora sp. NPDC050880]|uniref:phage holin family protein n=1 Tax=Promicromonospora sp. NPDC050880 TaxID=3364406 RepID=UPI0037A0EE82
MPGARDPFGTSTVAEHTRSGPDGARGTSRSAGDLPSLGELVSEVTSDLSTLVRQEVALAKAEATESARRAGKGAGMFGGAGVAGHMVLLFGSLALWWALGSVLGGGWGALVVAAVWAVVAAVLALRGRAELRAVRGVPQTAETVRKIPDALRGHADEPRGDHPRGDHPRGDHPRGDHPRGDHPRRDEERNA